MLKQREAVEKLEEGIRTSRPSRLYWNAYWALEAAYARANQWAYADGSPVGSYRVKRLHNIIDPRRTDVRVTLDMIHKVISRIVAATKPQRLSVSVIPAGGNPQQMAAKHVFEGLLDRRLAAIEALRVWRSIHKPRAVLGSAGVRRQLTSAGEPIRLPEGASPEDRDLQIRDLQVSWARVHPAEIVRDPGCNSRNPDEDDTFYAVEKPRTTAWVRRNFKVDIQTEITLGKLTAVQQELRSAMRYRNSEYASDSREPAVMIYEAYFQDPDIDQPWPWQLIAAMDPQGKDAGKLTALHWGRSPFFRLPVHWIHYDETLEEPWGRGVPDILKGPQDIRNMAVTNILRVMIDHMPKWLIQKGTVENVADALMNRSDKPLIYNVSPTGVQNKPERISAPAPPSSALELVGLLSQEGPEMVNISDVLMGRMNKRGQSGEAYQINADQGEVPLNDLRKDDELTLNALLHGTLIDTVRLSGTYRRDRLYEMLENDFGRQQIDLALREDPVSSIRAVQVAPEVLRPKPPSQIRDDFMAAVHAGLKDKRDAQFEMLVQGDVVFDSTMAEAFRRQEMENAMMLAGQDVVPDQFEDHDTAVRVLAMFMSSPRFVSLDEQRKDLFLRHAGAHKQAQFTEALSSLGGGAGMAQPQIPSTGMGPTPPAAPEEAQPSGTVGPVALEMAG